MNSFLITYKPSTESPERVWPLSELLRLVSEQRNGQVHELWRFRKKDANVGERVFLILQGERGPAVIGHGDIVEKPKKVQDKWQALVRFAALVDPSKPLVTKNDLLKIRGAQHLWRTQSRGVLMPADVAAKLTTIMAGMAL